MWQLLLSSTLLLVHFISHVVNFIGGAGRLLLPCRTSDASCRMHLQVLSKADTERFVAAVHLLLAPGGVFFGSTGGAEEAGAAPVRSVAWAISWREM